MELLLISESRLKIILSDADMEKYEITSDTMEGSDSETKRAIRCILDEAKRRIGFDVCGGNIFVQIFPSKDGGCEMFVTKTVAITCVSAAFVRLSISITQAIRLLKSGLILNYTSSVYGLPMVFITIIQKIRFYLLVHVHGLKMLALHAAYN